MGSYNNGKDECCSYIRNNFPTSASILDVGACDGKWRRLLPEFPNMDAVEIFPQNAVQLINAGIYRYVFQADIRDFQYEHYDMVIFGDVIEHMSVAEAQAVLEYAKPRCRDMIIAVPFLWKQGIEYGNKWEIHVQDDLTPELFDERYPGYEVLCAPNVPYRYYHKGAQ